MFECYRNLYEFVNYFLYVTTTYRCRPCRETSKVCRPPATRARFSASHFRADGIFFILGAFTKVEYPCEASRQVKAGRRTSGHRDARRSVPTGTLCECLRQTLCEALIGHKTRLQMQGLDFEHPVRAMGLGIYTPDQCAVMQQGEHEVAVLALGLRRVTLDAVVKSEHHRDTLPVPHQGIERRQQRGVARFRSASRRRGLVRK